MSIRARFQNDLEIDSLVTFFSEPENAIQLIKLLTRKSKVTRSLVDWFVTNYVKEHDIEYIVDGDLINVNVEYKTMLGRYGKKKSDPFNRENTFPLHTGIPECPTIRTSKKQLCFVKWAIQRNILNYIEENYTFLSSVFQCRVKTSRPCKTTSKKQPNTTKETTLAITYYTEPIRINF